MIKTSSLWQVCVVDQAGLCQTSWEISKDRFSDNMAHLAGESGII